MTSNERPGPEGASNRHNASCALRVSVAKCGVVRYQLPVVPLPWMDFFTHGAFVLMTMNWEQLKVVILCQFFHLPANYIISSMAALDVSLYFIIFPFFIFYRHKRGSWKG